MRAGGMPGRQFRAACDLDGAHPPVRQQGGCREHFRCRIYAIRRRRDRRRPFEVRWHAAGRTRSRSFTTRGLADSYRAELIRAARHGLEFSPGNGEPARWAGRNPAAVSWQEHAAAYAAMKWPHAAAHTRAGIADALATITLALTKPATTRKPAPAVLRTALYQHAFSPAQPGTGPAAAAALDWAQRHSLPLQELDDPKVIRLALEAGDPAAGRHPRRGDHHHQQTRGVLQCPGLRGRTGPAGLQPHGPDPVEASPDVRRRGPAAGRPAPPRYWPFLPRSPGSARS
jgi:hypothetical protein